MKNSTIIVISVLVLLFTIKTFLKPRLEKKEVSKIVQNILVGWSESNFSIAQNYWETAKIREIPPIYGLKSHKINSVTLYTENKYSYANVVVTLEFTTNEFSPSGREWKFLLKDFKTGWRVMNFELQ